MRNFLDDESEERADDDRLTETDCLQLGIIVRAFSELHSESAKLGLVRNYGEAAAVIDAIDKRLTRVETDLEEARRG